MIFGPGGAFSGSSEYYRHGALGLDDSGIEFLFHGTVVGRLDAFGYPPPRFQRVDNSIHPEAGGRIKTFLRHISG